jgi:coiled-coil domain-containing protein 39
MIAYTKNVQAEANQTQVSRSLTQALQDAKNRQIETEQHFKQLAERENGRVKAEIGRIDKDLAKVNNHVFRN